MNTSTTASFTAIAGFVVGLGTAHADHGTPQFDNQENERPHFTLACTDPNGGATDHSLTLYPDVTSIRSISATFNASIPNTPFPGLVPHQFDAGTGVQNMDLFVQNGAGTKAAEKITAGFAINLDADTSQVVVNIHQGSNNPDKVICDIPFMER